MESCWGNGVGDCCWMRRWGICIISLFWQIWLAVMKGKKSGSFIGWKETVDLEVGFQNTILLSRTLRTCQYEYRFLPSSWESNTGSTSHTIQVCCIEQEAPCSPPRRTTHERKAKRYTANSSAYRFISNFQE